MGDRDACLPKGAVEKCMKSALPDDARFTSETRDLVARCATEFVHMIAGEANRIAEENNKSMITLQMTSQALESLGFGEYNADAMGVGMRLRESNAQISMEKRQKRKESERLATEAACMTEEELLRKLDEERMEELKSQKQPLTQKPPRPEKPKQPVRVCTVYDCAVMDETVYDSGKE